MAVNFLVHERLCEARLVTFVVPITAVTDQVNHEILVEFLAIGIRAPGGLKAGKRVIGDALAKEPALVNQSAEDKGWFFKIKVAKPAELGALMDAAAYKKLTEGKA